MHAADGTPAAWHADRHLIVTAPARTGGSTLLTRLLDPGDAYVNVASSHIPPIPDGIRFAGRDDLDGALAAADAQPCILSTRCVPSCRGEVDRVTGRYVAGLSWLGLSGA